MFIRIAHLNKKMKISIRNTSFLKDFAGHIGLMVIAGCCCITVPCLGQQHKKSKVSVSTIEGKIQNFGDGRLIGTIKDLKDNSFRADTITIRGGAFRHTINVREKQIVNYKADGDKFAIYRKVFKDGDTVKVDFANEKSRSIEIVVSAGSKIKIYGVAKAHLDAYPSGNTENDQLATLNRKIKPLFNQLSILNYTDKKNIRATVKAEDSLSTAISGLEYKFVRDNPSSIISSYIIWKEYEVLNKKDPAKADSLYGMINPKEDNIYTQQILSTQKSRTISTLPVAVGDMFPRFSSKLVYKGPGFDLDQTKGKYTLIDFWGTWCIPCIKEMPRLKTYYEKFQNKLNIVGIAGRDQHQNWMAFLNKNNYNWIQILDQGIPKLSDNLNVNVYPTKYLLDPSGKIIMIFKDANEEVWEKLDKLFGS